MFDLKFFHQFTIDRNLKIEYVILNKMATSNWTLHKCKFDDNTGDVIIDGNDLSLCKSAQYNILNRNAVSRDVSIRVDTSKNANLGSDTYSIEIVVADELDCVILYYILNFKRNSTTNYYERLNKQCRIPELTDSDILLDTSDDTVTLNPNIHSVYTVKFDKPNNTLEFLIDETYCFKYKSERLTEMDYLHISFATLHYSTASLRLTEII